VNTATSNSRIQPTTAPPAKSGLPELPKWLREDLAGIEELIGLGQHDAARRECRRLMDRADPRTFALVAELAAAARLDWSTPPSGRTGRRVTAWTTTLRGPSVAIGRCVHRLQQQHRGSPTRHR
jgi:hypothetical protein